MDVPLEDNTFTVINFFQSLEHHPQPIEALKKSYQLLAPGGICLVEVPNFAGFWRRVFRTFWFPLLVPQHQVHFDLKTMKKASKEAGFDKILLHKCMFFPFEGVASFGLWLWRVLPLPRSRNPDHWGWLLVPFVMMLLLVLYIFLEIPSQALLSVTRASGHQTIVVRKGEGEQP